MFQEGLWGGFHPVVVWPSMSLNENRKHSMRPFAPTRPGEDERLIPSLQIENASVDLLLPSHSRKKSNVLLSQSATNQMTNADAWCLLKWFHYCKYQHHLDSCHGDGR